MRTTIFLAACSAGLMMGEEFPTNAAQPGSALHEEMAEVDARIFDAFNSCKLDEFAAMFQEGVEFYHDQGGLTVGAAKVTGQVKENICGKVRRELVAGSLRVYPMQGYGALLVGRHRFYQEARGAAPTGVAQFIHLVKKVEGGWKVTRVISFDHAAP